MSWPSPGVTPVSASSGFPSPGSHLREHPLGSVSVLGAARTAGPSSCRNQNIPAKPSLFRCLTHADELLSRKEERHFRFQTAGGTLPLASRDRGLPHHTCSRQGAESSTNSPPRRSGGCGPRVRVWAGPGAGPSRLAQPRCSPATLGGPRPVAASLLSHGRHRPCGYVPVCPNVPFPYTDQSPPS